MTKVWGTSIGTSCWNTFPRRDHQAQKRRKKVPPKIFWGGAMVRFLLAVTRRFQRFWGPTQTWRQQKVWLFDDVPFQLGWFWGSNSWFVGSFLVLAKNTSVCSALEEQNVQRIVVFPRSDKNCCARLTTGVFDLPSLKPFYAWKIKARPQKEIWALPIIDFQGVANWREAKPNHTKPKPNCGLVAPNKKKNKTDPCNRLHERTSQRHKTNDHLHNHLLHWV